LNQTSVCFQYLDSVATVNSYGGKAEFVADKTRGGQGTTYDQSLGVGCKAFVVYPFVEKVGPDENESSQRQEQCSFRNKWNPTEGLDFTYITQEDFLSFHSSFRFIHVAEREAAVSYGINFLSKTLGISFHFVANIIAGKVAEAAKGTKGGGEVQGQITLSGFGENPLVAVLLQKQFLARQRFGGVVVILRLACYDTDKTYYQGT
jgi:hypothetical protein